ncbi:MAG: hypothetical protein AAFN74_20240, partial [Myxococcota bacterium]
MSTKRGAVRDITLDGLVRGAGEHSDSPKTVSKLRAGDTFGNRMVSARIEVQVSSMHARRARRRYLVLLAATAFGLLIFFRSADGRAGQAEQPYVSAQAYFHALRAELALDRSDWDTAHDELQLALVYDPSSVHLHDKLIRLALAQGHLTRARKYARRAGQMASERWEILKLQGIVARADARLDDAE